MNIDEMQAGREMDALIAIHVTKIEPKTEWMASSNKGESGYYFSFYRREVLSWIRRMKEYYPESNQAQSEVFEILHYPSYSTDIAAAWEVEEKIIQLDRVNEYLEALQAIANGIERGWTMTNAIIGRTYTVEETIKLVHATPEQRCRAALKALEANA